MRASSANGSTSPVLTSPALPTTAMGVQPAVMSASMARSREATSTRPERSSPIVCRFRRPSPRTPSARWTTWWVALLAYTRGSGMSATPSSEGRRPSRSPACCRAAPMPARLAVEPPAVRLAVNWSGNPSSSTSQRQATLSTRLPAWTHQRCEAATVAARLAAVATVVGIVVTQPENPGWPIRRPLGMTTSASRARTSSRPRPSTGRGSSRPGAHAVRRAAGSLPSNRRNCSSAGSSASIASVRPVVDAASAASRSMAASYPRHDGSGQLRWSHRAWEGRW